MIPGELIVPFIGLALAVVAITPFALRQRARERESRAAQVEALRYGLHEPVSLHPVVAAEACIGTGRCVEVCPEKNVLGIVDGQARPITPARCIGHGLCERACPVEAIQLVFGTEKRGIDIPRIRENFETNVPGLYIVGELGGMGLIGNAFEQGQQCVAGILKESRSAGDHDLDVVIVGCGPAGLSASLACQQAGLKFITVEKEDIGGTVRTYPRKKLVLTRPVRVPGYGKLSFREVRKEELVEVWEKIVADTGLQVAVGETVLGITAHPSGGFVVRTDAREVPAGRVILAIGRRGVPRKLGLPGEDLPSVAYSLREPDAFSGDRIVVVGGGDSAVEAALALAEQPGNKVRISYRKEQFSRIKPANQERIEVAQRDGVIEVLWSTRLSGIQPEAVSYVHESGTTADLANDYTFIFAGGELPTRFLAECGVEIDTKFGQP